MRRHLLFLGLLVIALATAGCSGPATPKPTPPAAADTPVPEPTATTAVPTVALTEGDVPMGFTEEGLPYMGDPDAPVTLYEHSEFQ